MRRCCPFLRVRRVKANRPPAKTANKTDLWFVAARDGSDIKANVGASHLLGRFGRLTNNNDPVIHARSLDWNRVNGIDGEE
jgi:hypothetical protein